jgi:hypothetical protein
VPIHLKLQKEKYGEQSLNLRNIGGELVRDDLLFGKPIAQSFVAMNLWSVL